MDYGALPPEINSARMYSGSGSTSMLAAAAAWDGLAMELVSTASSYQSVITGLVSEGWFGPTSSSMAAAVTPYMTWMSMTGAKAEQAASQATAAAGAYEAAFAMTVAPPEVAANRTQLATLIATNFLGLNTPAIAANEARYGEMWAQDAAAMYGYAASSAGASRLTSFSQPPQATNPDAQNDQAEKVAQATSTSTASGAQEALSQLTSQVPNALQSFASPVSGTSGTSSSALTSTSLTSGSLWDFLNSNFLNGVISGGYINPAIVEPAITASMADVNAVGLGGTPGTQAIPPMGSGSGNAGWTPINGALAPGAAGLPGGVPPLGSTGVPGTDSAWISAGSNQASTVGRLSVPQTWTVATQVENHAGAALPGGGWTSTALQESPAPVPGMPGMPAGNSAGRNFGTGPRYGFHVTVMPRPPAAG